MDPNQTLYEMITMIAEGDFVGADNAYWMLAGWIEGGGFRPEFMAVIGEALAEIEEKNRGR